MCCSALGQIVYGALMLICLGLTLVAMFTPGWSRTQQGPFQFNNNPNFPDSFGLFQFSCTFPGEDFGNRNCIQWFDNMPNYYKVVVATIIVAAILEIIALIWNLLTFCACCCKRTILHPLYVLSLLISILLAIAIAVFRIKNNDIIGDMRFNNGNIQPFFGDQLNRQEQDIGYSFYLACAALVAAILSIFAGIFSACCADVDM